MSNLGNTTTDNNDTASQEVAQGRVARPDTETSKALEASTSSKTSSQSRPINSRAETLPVSPRRPAAERSSTLPPATKRYSTNRPRDQELKPWKQTLQKTAPPLKRTFTKEEKEIDAQAAWQGFWV